MSLPLLIGGACILTSIIGTYFVRLGGGKNVMGAMYKGFLVTGPDLLDEQGHPPAGWPLSRDPYLLESSLPGVFVAGDVRAASVKRVASAVGEGALAVTLVHRHLEESR